MMKYECGMIEDLLPLYNDGICSEVSKNAVKEHLEECESCRGVFERLKDETVDELMIKEKEEVIDSQSKFFKRKSAIVGSVIAAIFAIPILVCLIADLAGGSGLGWFFIVLAAMLIPTSLFVVPLMVPENRMFYTMCSFTLSVIILLGVCCIYSRGNWFFIAASAALFGLTIVFAPFIACRRPVKNYLKNFKGLAVIGAYTVTFFLMMICIGITVKAPGFWGLTFAISAPILLMIWLMFTIIRYIPVNALAKTGSCITVLGIAGFVANEAAVYFTLKNAVDSNVIVATRPSQLSMVTVIVIGVILAVIGLVTGFTKKDKINAEADK